ncbi:hypothetical protein JOF34_002057 [Microbacterium amylolyticum]|uniref:Uncharacterized protein n=1 Tax=Microbacterium amylolyticum TaxID=936337 RepID=A0ABS4ZJK9_9MICO|nr:hypothetical protein [Microbacterium amylolyticum]
MWSAASAMLSIAAPIPAITPAGAGGAARAFGMLPAYEPPLTFEADKASSTIVFPRGDTHGTGVIGQKEWMTS